MAHHIAIIGAGFSGTAVGLALRRAEPHARVSIFDRSGTFGPGLAYGTPSPLHLLNVPSDLLGADAEDPAGFRQWLGARAAAMAPYQPRALYGRYLAETLAHAGLDPVVANVVRLERSNGGFRLEDADGREHRADAVVLATGHATPAVALSLAQDAAAAGRMWFAWRDQDRLETLAEDATVLCIGTGLTMIDMALSALEEHGARRFIALSSHGLTPLPHASTEGAGDLGERLVAAITKARPTIRARLQAFRRFLAVYRGRLDWRDAISAIRPRLPELWRTLPDAERRRFLRHAKSHWEIHRHRCASEVTQRIAGLRESGRLEIIAGRIDGIVAQEERFAVRYRPRGAAEDRSLTVDAVIDATPPCSDVRRLDDPLLRSLLDAGLIRADGLRLGIETDAAGRVLAADGRAIERLYYIGPGLRARDWEATAVAELRACAAVSATALVAELTAS
jgi:uncharacterized NAD(P)/FAD-binding protein YdhS